MRHHLARNKFFFLTWWSLWCKLTELTRDVLSLSVQHRILNVVQNRICYSEHCCPLLLIWFWTRMQSVLKESMQTFANWPVEIHSLAGCRAWVRNKASNFQFVNVPQHCATYSLWSRAKLPNLFRWENRMICKLLEVSRSR